jgi:hypothetical protein
VALNIVALSTVADATKRLISRPSRALKRTAKFKAPRCGARMRRKDAAQGCGARMRRKDAAEEGCACEKFWVMPRIDSWNY